MAIILTLGMLGIVALATAGCGQSRTPEIPPAGPEEVFVDFCIREVDLKERALVIEQLINEPNVILVDEKLPVREDAVIIFSTLHWVDPEKPEKGQVSEERIGVFEELEAGQEGGLIRDKEGKVRYINIGDVDLDD